MRFVALLARLFLSACFTVSIMLTFLRLEYTSGRDDEAAFLANLKSLWRGFINMPAVAKLVTKAFPVSGILDNVTEVKCTSLNILRVGKAVQCII